MRKRLASELIALLSDNMRVPVLSAEELKARAVFGPGHWARMLGSAAVAAGLFLIVFSHQEEVLVFLHQAGTGHRVLATVSLLEFVAAFANAYGGFTRQLLRLLKFE